ncbi:hypothetical protein [Methylobacterium sp. E-045]|uniref:hypothetical protein n=1 Tax=Methylobacterium sp. E-045 TaxID=2836575 RepID=UPI00391BED38
MFEHSYQALQATQAGLGLALSSLPLVAEDVSSGRLLVPLDAPAEYRRLSSLRPAPHGGRH